MTIDTHAHVFFIPEMIDYENRPLFEYMKIHDIWMSSCIAAANKENEEVVENVMKYPNKLFGIGYVNVHNLFPSLDNLKKNAELDIFRGIKMHPYVEDYQLDDPMINPVYETCLDLDIPVLFHTGWLTFNSWPSDDPGKLKSPKAECMGFPLQFAKVLERYPKLKIIFAHFGGNWYREFLGIAERFENAYLDTAWLRHYSERMFPSVTIQDWIEHAVKIIGSEKIMFGGEGTFPSDIEQCQLTGKQKEDILHRNAAKLYRM